jgi:hypothetical protein
MVHDKSQQEDCTMRLHEFTDRVPNTAAINHPDKFADLLERMWLSQGGPIANVGQSSRCDGSIPYRQSTRGSRDQLVFV